jgi:YHS domain-containing protein
MAAGLLLGGVLAVGATLGHSAQPKPEDAAKAKKALQEVQDFIGIWNLEGLQKTGPKTESWKEKVSWSWKFKGDDAWIVVEFAEGKGKYYSRGELRYLVDKKKYQLTLTTPSKTEEVYLGELKAGTLKLERADPKSGDVTRLSIETLADGVRMQFKVEKQDGGKGPFSPVYQMAGNKDGESIAGTTKKPECIVTGGAASIKVSYMGKDYFVCCTGCRDAFTENPEKFVKGKK